MRYIIYGAGSVGGVIGARLFNRARGVLNLGKINGLTRPGDSSWRSQARATGSIETDFLNGEIALLGRLHGVPTPLNAGLQALANAHARECRPPASMSVDDGRRFLRLS